MSTLSDERSLTSMLSDELAILCSLMSTLSAREGQKDEDSEL